ncbi:helix-turn-helix transcriptional regulator [Solicola gregarius]|uniref:helix-turn-helix transcriptional regulator n=1 Tax=Solicola gregarius TaxID=2908642 RepID=UPI00230626EB|nr:AAA family ATPase [Solicola gregarius]
MTPPAVSPAMVGREAELGGLRDALAATRDGHAVTVLVGGEAGAGKTRLVSEFADGLADDVRLHTGHCVELGSDGLAYTSLAGVIRSMIAEFGTDSVVRWAGAGAGALSRLIPELELDDPATDPGRGRLFEVVTFVLERAAAEHPLVVVIEDLQWADGSTRDLLRFAIRALAGAPLLLVLTYRTDEMSRTHPLRPFLAELDRLRAVRRVLVPRLDKADVARQLAEIWGRPADPDVTERVYRRSEGLPFFVEELAGAEYDGSPVGLPDSLRDLLLVRIERLSDQTQELLRVVAVGQTGRVAHWQLAAATDLAPSELDESLREAVSANVLKVEGDGYAFRHALLCEAVQDDTLPGEHARLHRRFADALANPIDSDPAASVMERAYHLFAASDHAGAFRAYLDAADHAANKYAYPEAQFALERVLELWDLVPEPETESGTDHASLLVRTASRATHAGELERALTLGDAAMREFGDDVDPDMRTELVLQRSRILSDLGRPTSVDELQATLDALPPEGHEFSRARLLSTMGARNLMAGDLVAAKRLRIRAVEAAERVGATDIVLKATTLVGSAEVQLGEIETGLATLERAKALQSAASPGAVLSYHVNASDALCLLGRYEEAARIAKAGIDDAKLAGRARTLGAIILGNAAEPLVALGRWESADRLIMRGLELNPPMRHFWQLTALRTSLRTWQGDIDDAERTFADIRSIAGRADVDPQYSIPTSRAAAEIALAHDDADTAWAAVATCLDDTRRLWGYDLPLIATGARALALRRTEGADIAADARRLRTELDVIGDWGPAPSWRAVLEAELADTGHPAAWDAVVRAPWLPAYVTAYARMRRANAYIERGERAAATAALDDARTAAEKLGARLLVGQVEDLGRRAGFDDRPGTDNGLTPREHEVLRLVCDGCTNGQIGERLFISTKTASVHVSNILAKLEVSTRGEAAAVGRALVGDAPVR